MSSDPAINAADKALDWMFNEGRIARSLSVVAKDGALNGAREALAPLREIHRPVSNDLGGVWCAHCVYEHGHDDWTSTVRRVPWPCATARLIYPEDEL